MLGLFSNALPAPRKVKCCQCVYPLQLVFTSSSISFWWELKDRVSKEKAKQNRLTDRQDRQTANWYPLREGHSSAVMLPQVNGEPNESKKRKPRHIPSPSSGESERKAGQRALTKDTEKTAGWSNLT